MDRLMDAKEVADLLRVSTARVYDLTRQNFIPHVHLGRQVRYDPRAISDWVRNGGQALEGGWRRDPGSGSSVFPPPSDRGTSSKGRKP